MDKHTTWVTFTVTEDGYRARPICDAPGIPTGCCTRFAVSRTVRMHRSLPGR